MSSIIVLIYRNKLFLSSLDALFVCPYALWFVLFDDIVYFNFFRSMTEFINICYKCIGAENPCISFCDVSDYICICGYKKNLHREDEQPKVVSDSRIESNFS